jgi:hypothetical protein
MAWGMHMKMPVGDTLEGAFSFTFRSFLSVIGTVWFPYLVAGAILTGTVYLLHPDWHVLFAPNADTDPAVALAKLRSFGPLYAVSWPVFLITFSMVRVGLMRKALGLHEGPVFIFYSLGPAVWRLIGAYLLLSLIFIVVILMAIFGCVAVLTMAGRAIPQPGLAIVDTVAVIAAVIAPFYVMVRMAFFINAVVVAENRIGIGRAWELGGSNVLRIILVVLTLFICMGFVFGIASSFFMPPFPVLSGKMDPQVIVNWEFGMFRSPGFLVIYVLQTIILAALNTGAEATAYRAITGTAAEGLAS